MTAVSSGTGLMARSCKLPRWTAVAVIAFAVLLLASAQTAAAARAVRSPAPPPNRCNFCATLRRVPPRAIDDPLCANLTTMMTKNLTSVLRGAGAKLARFNSSCDKATGEVQVCNTARGLNGATVSRTELDKMVASWTYWYYKRIGFECLPMWGVQGNMGVPGGDMDSCLFSGGSAMISCELGSGPPSPSSKPLSPQRAG